jgi:hypothetical protein
LQPPQFADDVFVSTQAPPQVVSPPEQPAAHCPLWHTMPLAHAPLHEPQCRASLVRSAQTPLHNVCPVGQPQRPLMHGVPAAQATPQVPQLAVVVIRSTHEPLQTLCPLGQAVLHLPCTHDSPDLHAAPHAPQ